jgi:hypothetical protein
VPEGVNVRMRGADATMRFSLRLIARRDWRYWHSTCIPGHG